jgi:hypothetical protein
MTGFGMDINGSLKIRPLKSLKSRLKLKLIVKVSGFGTAISGFRAIVQLRRRLKRPQAMMSGSGTAMSGSLRQQRFRSLPGNRFRSLRFKKTN